MVADQKQTVSKELENGDVIRVGRKILEGRVPLYDHYGIYSEDRNSVIHYQEPKKAMERMLRLLGAVWILVERFLKHLWRFSWVGLKALPSAVTPKNSRTILYVSPEKLSK